MSLEAITKIRKVESDMEQAKVDAKAQVQKMLVDVEREGRALLQQGKAQAAEKAAEAMRRAEAEAAQRREKILAQAEEDCRALRAQADARMDKATQAILGRVVGS